LKEKEAIMELRKALEKVSGLGRIERMVLEAMPPESVPNNGEFTDDIYLSLNEELSRKQVYDALQRLLNKNHVDRTEAMPFWWRDSSLQPWESEFWNRGVESALSDLFHYHYGTLSTALRKMKTRHRAVVLAILLKNV